MEFNQETSAAIGSDPSTSRDYPVTFSASGSEYFRIWIVNLLLIVVTLGIYLPWAKVRKLRYFFGNTLVHGHALDFHGNAPQMLRGTLVAGAFLIAYSVAAHVSGWAGLIAAVAFVALWPLLFLASMRFRLANTSWRGLRFRFTGDKRGAYQTIMPPIALFLLPFALLAVLFEPVTNSKQVAGPVDAVIGLMFLLLFASMPYFLWRTRSYQHGNYAFGDLKAEFRCGAGAFYGVAAKTVGVALLGSAACALGFGLIALVVSGAVRTLLAVPLMVAMALSVSLLPKVYAQTRLQNLIWSATGNDSVRFVSRLAFRPYALLQLKNLLLIMLTLGLYWPFAVVANRRAQLQALTLSSQIDLDEVVGVATEGQADAAGDAAADLFGLDIGM